MPLFEWEEFPEGAVCPICKTSDKKPCSLIAKDSDPSLVAEAQVFHSQCIQDKLTRDLRYSEEQEVVYFFI